MFYLSLLLALFLQFILAELLGRSKHIGRWWMFFLLSSTFIIGGLVAWVFSPNAKKEPQKPNKILSIIGVIILILGTLGLVSVLITLNTAFYVLSAPLSFIATGSYIMALGNGRIRNNNPKFYFSWLQLNTSGLLSSFEDALKNKKDEISYYFVKEGENQKGPFTFQELVNARITEETLLWRRGMDKFSRAGDIDELKGAVVYLPPTIDQIEHVEEKMPNTDINPSPTIEQNESVITNEELTRLVHPSIIHNIEGKLMSLSSNVKKLYIITMSLFFIIFLISVFYINNEKYNFVVDTIKNDSILSDSHFPNGMEGRMPESINNGYFTVNGENYEFFFPVGSYEMTFEELAKGELIKYDGWNIPSSNEITELYKQNVDFFQQFPLNTDFWTYIGGENQHTFNYQLVKNEIAFFNPSEREEEGVDRGVRFFRTGVSIPDSSSLDFSEIDCYVIYIRKK